jgi:hypothetical protein
MMIAYKGVVKARTERDSIIWVSPAADLNDYLAEACVSLATEVDEEGNEVLYRTPPSLLERLAKLRELGFDITEELS